MEGPRRNSFSGSTTPWFALARHTLATRLLHEQTPFQVIGDILGHAASTSTLIYAEPTWKPYALPR
ncbi:tyrosine-type recombinase/integrase [Paraburkholderia sabiae]|uniref:tyrosine-type recombinase/integrase n=1 Tax=Paraburkholderia sabiae TaxID=273251 RepID=UPI0019182B9D